MPCSHHGTKKHKNIHCNLFLLNDATNIRNFTFTGLTGTKRAGGLYEVTVTSANSFTIPTSTSEYDHSYVKGGNVIKEGDEGTNIGVASISYAYATGELTVNTSTNHGLSTSDYITLGRARFNVTDVGEFTIPKGVEIIKTI